MTTTRQSAAVRTMERRRREARKGITWRLRETVLLVVSSLLVGFGLWLVQSAKTREFTDFPKLIDIDNLTSSTQLLPALSFTATPEEREFISRKIYSLRGKHLPNAGAISGIRVNAKEVAAHQGLDNFKKRIADSAAREAARDLHKRNWFSTPEPRVPTAALLTPEQIRQLKPAIAVRSPEQFRHEFLLWAGIYFLSFYVVHLVWRWKGFAGDEYMLPVIHLLSGAGLILMVSMRDPLRDTLMFRDFAQGAIIGCLLLLLCSLRDYEHEFRGLSFVWLGLGLFLALCLGLFGSGPGESDAKVNLFFFQPMEVIRILLVLFLAGYFARNWDALRDLKTRRGPLSRFALPRIEYVLPVAIGLASALIMFFLLKDLGPALVVGCLFLAMFSVARKRPWAAIAGLALVVLVFWIAHSFGIPQTVTQRINMRNSPWDNYVHGGDQLAHSLWALSSGGLLGSGLGMGSPDTIPAGHTDLVVSALGEEWGLVGVLAVYILYGFLLWRCVGVALRANGVYSFFLVIGLATVTALQIILITGGLLGMIPLSGVVSPFLSFGRTSMAANFALFGMILAVSSRSRSGKGVPDQTARFGTPVKYLAYIVGFVFVGLMARAAVIQTKDADDIAARAALVVQASGPRQYEYNPRLTQLARSISKGEITDRNGLPLASSDWSKVEAHRADYAAIGAPLPAAPGNQRRFYPLGPKMFYLLGDVTSKRKRGAPNTAFLERASRIRLQGFDDYAELEVAKDPVTGANIRRIKYDYRDLVPLLRHRNEPESTEVKDLTGRNRDVKMSIDARFQMQASAILEAALHKLGKSKGSLVVLDPDNGDLLAAVSYPWPAPAQFATLSADPTSDVNDDDLQDRARYGLYPPGSSFKIVTAIAALRKDPALAKEVYSCIRLSDGRNGNFVGKSKRPIRDDVMDKSPHGQVDMAKGIAVSCNAYFAQLGAYKVGAKSLFDTAGLFGISTANPNTPEKLREALPQASYGQGQVVVSPFQMARVAASVANGGKVLQGRWVIDDSNSRLKDPVLALPTAEAERLGGFMRGVITSGTGRSLEKSAVPIAGKTGTAELANQPSHAWFIGYAPYNVPGKRIAFAVLVENGQYGGTAAAPIAGDLVAAAHQLGII
jgi:cell division protein FtsI/penicillin-binding protein 2/cell division protein FtsW (lipid II flippase)